MILCICIYVAKYPMDYNKIFAIEYPTKKLDFNWSVDNELRKEGSLLVGIIIRLKLSILNRQVLNCINQSDSMYLISPLNIVMLSISEVSLHNC